MGNFYHSSEKWPKTSTKIDWLSSKYANNYKTKYIASRRGSVTTEPKVVHLTIPSAQASHKRKYSVHTLSEKSMNSQSERDYSIRNKSFEIQKLNIDVKI